MKMNQKNKTRIWLSLLLLFLSICAVAIGAAVVGLSAHVLQFGMQAQNGGDGVVRYWSVVLREYGRVSLACSRSFAGSC